MGMKRRNLLPQWLAGKWVKRKMSAPQDNDGGQQHSTPATTSNAVASSGPSQDASPQQIDNFLLWEDITQMCNVRPQALKRSASVLQGDHPRPDTPAFEYLDTGRGKKGRRNSTSAYQISRGGQVQVPSSPEPEGGTAGRRRSPLLGLVALQSPGTPQELCSSAVEAWRSARASFWTAWRSVCMGHRAFASDAQGLWAPLAEFNLALDLCAWLLLNGAEGATGCCCAEEARRVRRRYMDESGQAQNNIKKKTRGAVSTSSSSTEAAAEEKAEGRDSDDDDSYPKDIPTQLITTVVSECCRMEDQIGPLIAALERYSKHRRQRCRAQRGRQAFSRIQAGDRKLKADREECRALFQVFITQLDEACGRVCRAAGVEPGLLSGCSVSSAITGDASRVMDDSFGAQTHGSKTTRRRHRVLIFALRAELALLWINYHCAVLPGRLAIRILERMARKPAEIAGRHQTPTEATLRDELDALANRILRLLEKTERVYPETIDLLDSRDRRRIAARSRRLPTTRHALRASLKLKWRQTLGWMLWDNPRFLLEPR